MKAEIFPGEFTDQMQRTIRLPKKPLRIISLVPSQTELLFDLGLNDEVVGITKFCIHPDSWFRSKTRVGGTKNIDFEKIRSLQPDLIIGNKEENEQEQIEQLMKEFPVWMSDITTLDQAYSMMQHIGEICGKADKANQLVSEIRNQFNEFDQLPKKKIRAAYFIWQKPYMCAGKGTFIDHLMEKCGFVNVSSSLEGRYPEMSREMIGKCEADLLLLSSEPYPFGEKHITAFSEILPSAKVMTVDGEMFSWYGSRLKEATGYFTELLNLLNKTEN